MFIYIYRERERERERERKTEREREGETQIIALPARSWHHFRMDRRGQSMEVLHPPVLHKYLGFDLKMITRGNPFFDFLLFFNAKSCRLPIAQ